MTTFIAVRTPDGYKNIVISSIKKLEIDKDILIHSISSHKRYAYRLEYEYLGESKHLYTDLENYLYLKDKIKVSN